MTDDVEDKEPTLEERQRTAATQITSRSETLAMMVTDILDAVLAGDADRTGIAYETLLELMRLELAAAKDRGRASTVPADAAQVLASSLDKGIRHLQHVKHLLTNPPRPFVDPDNRGSSG